MSEQPHDSWLEQSGATDESLLVAHEKAVEWKSENYSFLPLFKVLFFSGLSFYAGTYLNHFSGQYSASVYDENAQPSAAGAATATKIDPIVYGKKSYEQVCITCHQATGQGVPNIYPPLAGSEWVNGSPERLVRIVLHGLKGPLNVAGKEYGQTSMPAIGKVAGSGYNWNDERIAAVLTYIRQEWGNTGTPITTEQVAAIHAKEGNRPEWSQEELLKIQ